VFKRFAKPITHAQSVRNALTVGRIPASDRLARFVGAEAYETAGGRIGRDLFETDVVFFDDGELLQKLAGERLEAAADGLRAEGWAWVETLLGHGQVEGCTGERLHPTQRKLKPAEKKAIGELEATLSALEGKLEDADEDNPLWADRDDVEAKLDALRDSVRVYDSKLMAHAGALVSVDRDGRINVTRGLIKRADVKTIAKLRDVAVKKPLADGVEGEDVETAIAVGAEGPRLTKALTERLTEARTRGLRASLAANPQVALALTVYVLMRGSAANEDTPGIGVRCRPVGFDDDDAFGQARTRFAGAFEDDGLDVLSVCLDQPAEKLIEMLAMFVAETLDFSHGGLLRQDRELQRFSDCLAAALDLDMTKHWEASTEFWEAAPKAMAIEALITAPSVARLDEKERSGMIAAFGKMKKSDLARTASEALKGVGWLPDLLITPAREGAFAVTAGGKQALDQTGDAAAA
jgi:ParB family transcriptional regulator, chromosome partitioning protein